MNKIGVKSEKIKKQNSYSVTIFVLIASVLLLGDFLFCQLEKEQIRMPGKSVFNQPFERSTPYVLARIKGKVTLDGLSNESVWSDVKPLPVTMHVPSFGSKPTERTEILVAYDDNYLYVAGRLYDSEPLKIQAPSKKRDDLRFSNDWFGVVIDTFNDNENAMAFFTTPTGLRMDMTIIRNAQIHKPATVPGNSSWNTFWDVATARNHEGWFAEIRIPFSSLRFQGKDGQVEMGLISWRWIARKSEFIIFPDIPPDWGFWSPCKPSEAQTILFEGLSSRKSLYVTPYALGGFGQTFDLNEVETAYLRDNNLSYEGGLDVKYGLTSNLTLDVSLNTDFAQVEADDELINLTRFSLFYPEKRLFFQERSSIFEVRLGGRSQLFYSRRIGIYEETPVRIYGGVRLVGRAGPWDLGFLDVQTAPVEDLTSENFGVLRVRRQVFNSFSYLGGLITSRVGTDGAYNVVYGLDGNFRLFGDEYLVFNWAQSFETDKENNPISLVPTRFRLNWERRSLKGFGFDLDATWCGKDFNPGIGFQNRDDYNHVYSRFWYGWFPGEGSLLLRHQASISGLYFASNERRVVESASVNPKWDFESKSGYFVSVGAKLNYEDVPEPFELSDDTEIPVGRYTFYDLIGVFQTPKGRRFNSAFTLKAGPFYGGRRVSVGVESNWGVSSSLELSVAYLFNQVEFPERNQEFISHIARLRALAMLSTKFSAAVFIQYNSASDAVTTNIRIRYNPREGNDFYIVYNEGLNTNRSREDPVLPYLNSRTLLLKYSYTFNF